MGRGEKSLLCDPPGSELRLREREKEREDNKWDGKKEKKKEKGDGMVYHRSLVRFPCVLVLRYTYYFVCNHGLR